MHGGGTSAALRARELGVSRGTLYYKPKKPDKDWALKCRIEEALREQPSYGHRRLALHLRMNKKRVRRVMNLFGIKPYRRRGRKWKKTAPIRVQYPNLLLAHSPQHEHHIWAADFTHLSFQGKEVYVATVLDLFTRKVVGLSVCTARIMPLPWSCRRSWEPSIRIRGQ